MADVVAVFDVLCEGILIIDAEARITYGNKAYCDFLELESSQITGKLLRDVRPGVREYSALRFTNMLPGEIRVKASLEAVFPSV